MPDNKTNINPRYLTYNKDEVQALLSKVNHPDATPTAGSDELITSGGVAAAIETATTAAAEADVRAIVTGYSPEEEKEESEQEEPSEGSE